MKSTQPVWHSTHTQLIIERDCYRYANTALLELQVASTVNQTRVQPAGWPWRREENIPRIAASTNSDISITFACSTTKVAAHTSS
jgi:hypothetical protein